MTLKISRRAPGADGRSSLSSSATATLRSPAVACTRPLVWALALLNSAHVGQNKNRQKNAYCSILLRGETWFLLRFRIIPAVQTQTLKHEATFGTCTQKSQKNILNLLLNLVYALQSVSTRGTVRYCTRSQVYHSGLYLW